MENLSSFNWDITKGDYIRNVSDGFGVPEKHQQMKKLIKRYSKISIITTSFAVILIVLQLTSKI